MATAVSFSEWHDEISMHAPGASIAGMELALKSTIAEFLRDSGAFLIETPGITPVGGRNTYYLDPQPEGPVLYIHSIAYNGRFLVPMQTPSYQSRAFEQPSGDAPRAFRTYADAPGKFTLVPGIADDGLYEMVPYVSIGFSGTCQEAVAHIFKLRWYDYILQGTLGKLLSQQNKPYFNLQLAYAHSRKFRAGIAQARDMANRQFSSIESDFLFPKWA
jgi:hypothetical protein